MDSQTVDSEMPAPSAPMRSKLTDIGIEKLPVPPVGQKTYLDSIVEPFGVRVSAGGAKTHIVQGRVKGEKHPTRLKIGRVGAITLKDARERARAFLAMMNDGKHPSAVFKEQREARAAREAAARVAAEHSFATVRDKFLEDHCRRHLRPHTAYTYASILHLPELKAWESRPIATITRNDAEDLLDRVEANHPPRVKGKPAYTARNLKRCASSMWNKYVMRKRLAPANPFARLVHGKSERRQRALKPAELYVLWRAFAAAPAFTAAYKLMPVTGERRGEVAGIMETELENLDGRAPLWRLPGTRTKNHRPHVIPLPPLAVEILRAVPRTEAAYLFSTRNNKPISGWSPAKNAVLAINKRKNRPGLKRHPQSLSAQRAQMPDRCQARDAIDSLLHDYRAHDFRRTVVTGINELGVPDDVSS